MISMNERIDAFAALGARINQLIETMDSDQNELQSCLQFAKSENGWFIEKEVLFALNYWAQTLNKKELEDWFKGFKQPNKSKRIGLILAGNIPMVGFHDVLAVILSGHKALIKCSSTDRQLIPFLLNQLVWIEPRMKEHFDLLNQPMKEFDAVIATGSNNSARHFEEYFGHVPNIIRKNRTAVAVLDGTEGEAELEGLMEDCFRYFGLGCRNVTKLYLPKGFELNEIFKASLPFSYLMEHKKYINNYTYHKTLLIMERKNVLDNELLLLHESDALYSPVSVLNYEYYENTAALSDKIEKDLDKIQCVIGVKNLPFGTAQKPSLTDYADGVNTLDFLEKLDA